MISIILFFITTFIVLFILFSVARHDFVLIRQSISLRQAFDNAMLSFIFAFVFGRVFYAIENNAYEILHPLRFFHLTRYEGVLIFAGFLGAYMAILFLYRKKKNKLRIFDIYFLSFFPFVILDILLKSNNGIGLLLKAVSLVVLFSFYSWFIKIHNEFSVKDGFICFLGAISYALVLLAFSFASGGVFSLPHLIFQTTLIGLTIFSAIMLFLIHRNVFNKN